MADKLAKAELATWRKSSYSGGEGNCVEIAATPDITAVRDSKMPGGTALYFGEQAWGGFLDSVRRAAP